MASETQRKKTKICCLDLDKDLLDFLDDRFDVYNGSIGKRIDVAGKNLRELHLLPNFDIPSNIQEYEVFVEDLNNISTIPFFSDEHFLSENNGTSAYYFISKSPQTIYDFCPYGIKIFQTKVKFQRRRPSILIVFQAPNVQVEYYKKNISSYQPGETMLLSNYCHLNNVAHMDAEGTEVKLCNSVVSRNLFESFLNDVTYHQVFIKPALTQIHKTVEDERFIPLLLSKGDNVVSYMWTDEKDIAIVLPQTAHKKELLEKVFQELIFPRFSSYFPEIAEKSWLNKEIYFLPNHSNLLSQKEEITAKYNDEIKNINQEISDNLKKYYFLHCILTATGTELVKSMIEFLKWLGFENVIDKDETHIEGTPFEEDIQIDLGEKGLLVIEIKGINGTSTDSQCSQINKIVHRRCKERNKFDVHGLYIVNNQLNIEPLGRTLPPFTTEQITDAQNDERGLGYSWQFFNLFYDIENGIITKSEARQKLWDSGLIDFSPNVIELGVPHNYYLQHTVASLMISGIPICVGDFLYYRFNGRWNKRKVITIKDGDTFYEKVTTGDYGFGFEERVPNNVSLYCAQKPEEVMTN